MRFLKNLSVYAFVGFFGAGINFLLMPVLSHHLSPVDYGLTSLLNTYVSLLTPLISVVAFGLISVSYFQITDKKEFAALFSSVAFIPLLPTALLFLSCWASYDFIGGVLELPVDAKWWALSMFPIALLSVYIETTVAYLVYTKQSTIYAAYNILKTLLELGLTVLFVVVWRMGWKGRILAWLLAMLVFSTISFIYFRRKKLLTADIRWTYIRQGILFGAPLILHTLGKFAVNQSDRLFISKMVSVSEAGIYSVGYTIGTVMLIVGTALTNVLGPRIMENLKDNNVQKQRQIRRITYAAIAGLVAMLGLISGASPFFFHYFMDVRYAEGGHYVFWVSLGYFFWSVYMLFSPYIYYYKKNSYLAVLAVVNITSNVVFNYVFIKHYGGIGAAYATALSFLLNLLLLLVKVIRMLPWIRFQWADFRPVASPGNRS